MTYRHLAESLESRRLLSAILGANGALAVAGTELADVIGLAVRNGVLRVDVNGALTRFAPAAVTSISIDLGAGADRLVLASGVIGAYVLGGLGDDTIEGGDGNDSITAGGGRDWVVGGAGDDRIDGGPTSDRLFGGDGADRIYGGDANDVIEGGAGVDRVFAGGGNDQVLGGSSNDKLYGDAGDDSLIGNGQNDLLVGGAGNDLIRGGDGNDTASGGDDHDNLYGDAGDDQLAGDSGYDFLNGGGGNDSLAGGDESDSIEGSLGSDQIDGGRGDDKLYGDDGADTLDGGDGLDSLSGGAGEDNLFGGLGNDALFGGADTDALAGNGGADRLLNDTADNLINASDSDAAINFVSDNRAWSEQEIWEVDTGLQWLQERTGSTRLLKRHDGAEVTFRRTWTLGARTLAINYGNGIIDIADLTFSDSTGVPATIIHELGHNWDTEAENPTAKQFFDLSRWRKRLLVGWTYDDNAEFANDYGRTNPQEDFATALEVYFSRENPPSQWQAKWDYIDGFLDSLA